MYEKTILCLANSRKPPHPGRCVAGKEFANAKTGAWLRPVSARPKHEVSVEERRYEDGTLAQLLDIVSVPLMEASPFGHQVENHVLDADYYWTKEGVATWDQVIAAVDPYDDSFWSHSLNTYHGRADKVSEAHLADVGSSLKLILVKDLTILVRTEDGYEGSPARRRVRGAFTGGKSQLGKDSGLFSISDPEIEDLYLAKGNGTYQIGEAVLCISLAELWNGYAFRVIASVITPDRCG